MGGGRVGPEGDERPEGPIAVAQVCDVDAVRREGHVEDAVAVEVREPHVAAGKARGREVRRHAHRWPGGGDGRVDVIAGRVMTAGPRIVERHRRRGHRRVGERPSRGIEEAGAIAVLAIPAVGDHVDDDAFDRGEVRHTRGYVTLGAGGRRRCIGGSQEVEANRVADVGGQRVGELHGAFVTARRPSSGEARERAQSGSAVRRITRNRQAAIFRRAVLAPTASVEACVDAHSLVATRLGTRRGAGA